MSPAKDEPVNHGVSKIGLCESFLSNASSNQEKNLSAAMVNRSRGRLYAMQVSELHRPELAKLSSIWGGVILMFWFLGNVREMSAISKNLSVCACRTLFEFDSSQFMVHNTSKYSNVEVFCTLPDTTQISQPIAVCKALKIFRKRGGMMRMAESIAAGIHRNTLYRMVDEGLVERVSRGLYRLADAEPLGNPDLVTIAAKVPDGVICLISALAFHNLTTQIPHEVYLAISRNSEPPRIHYPPVRSFRFSGKAFSEGIERPKLDGIKVPIYCREKTIADCFKFRNQIGLDTAIEAVKFYKDQPKPNVKALLKYASICRVTKVIRPYLEAIL